MQIKPYIKLDSNVEGTVLTFVDITELKKAEGELIYRAQNEESLASLGEIYAGTYTSSAHPGEGSQNIIRQIGSRFYHGNESG